MVRGAIVLFVVVACNSDAVQQPLESTKAVTFAIDSEIQRPDEDGPLAIAGQVDAFAGYYCLEGDLYVAHTSSANDADRAKLVSLVEASGVSDLCYNRQIGPRKPTIIRVEKKHAFLELRSWRDTLTDEIFEVPGVISLGIDYEQNVLVLTISDGTSDTAIHAAVATLGVPSDLFVVVPEEPPSLTTACPAAPYATAVGRFSIGGGSTT